MNESKHSAAPEKPSKSAQKRAQQALRELGEQLVALPEDQLSRLRLDDTLLSAVNEARRIKSHSALRRQKQLLAKLLRQTDAAAIQAELQSLRSRSVAAKRLFARAELWRDRIADNGRAAVAEFCEQTGASEDALLPLLGDLGRAHSDRDRKTVRRQLFRAVNEALVASEQGDKLRT